jgi:hypothetical protein
VYQRKQRELEKKRDTYRKQFRAQEEQERQNQISAAEEQQNTQNPQGSRHAQIENALRERRLFERACMEVLLSRAEKIEIYPEYMRICFLSQERRKIERNVSIPGTGTVPEKEVCKISEKEILNRKIKEESGERNCMEITYGIRFQYAVQKQKQRESVLALLRGEPQLTAKEIAEALQLTVSQVHYAVRAQKRQCRQQ